MALLPEEGLLAIPPQGSRASKLSNSKHEGQILLQQPILARTNQLPWQNVNTNHPLVGPLPMSLHWRLSFQHERTTRWAGVLGSTDSVILLIRDSWKFIYSGEFTDHQEAGGTWSWALQYGKWVSLAAFNYVNPIAHLTPCTLNGDLPLRYPQVIAYFLLWLGERHKDFPWGPFFLLSIPGQKAFLGSYHLAV